MTIVMELATSDSVSTCVLLMAIAPTEVFVRVIVFVSSMKIPLPVWSIQTARQDDVMMECVHPLGGVMQILSALKESFAPLRDFASQVAPSISTVELMRCVTLDVVSWEEPVRQMQNVAKAEPVPTDHAISPVDRTRNVAEMRLVSAVNAAPDVMKPHAAIMQFAGAVYV